MKRSAGLLLLLWLMVPLPLVAQAAVGPSPGSFSATWTDDEARTTCKAAGERKGKENEETKSTKSNDELLKESWKAYQLHTDCLKQLKNRANTSDEWLLHKLLTDRVEVLFRPHISNTIKTISTAQTVAAGLPFKFKPELVQLSYTLPSTEVFKGRSRLNRYFLNYWELGANVGLAPPDDTLKCCPAGQLLHALKGTSEIYLQFKLPLAELREGKWLKDDINTQAGERDKARDALLRAIVCNQLKGQPGASPTPEFCPKPKEDDAKHP